MGIFRSPLYTLFYFFTKVLPEKALWCLGWLRVHRSYVAAVAAIALLYVLALNVEGPQQIVCCYFVVILFCALKTEILCFSVC